MKAYVEHLIIAKHNYCVPTVLQMVLEHYGIRGFTQEIIAEQLTMVPDDKNIDHANWGAQITDNTLNDFFKNNGINLYEHYIHINHFMDEYFLVMKYIICYKRESQLFMVLIIHGYMGIRKITYRHVSIIVPFNPKSEMVNLLDPGPKEVGYKEVSADKLYQAIKAGKDGLWCINEIKNW